MFVPMIALVRNGQSAKTLTLYLRYLNLDIYICFITDIERSHICKYRKLSLSLYIYIYIGIYIYIF